MRALPAGKGSGNYKAMRALPAGGRSGKYVIQRSEATKDPPLTCCGFSKTVCVRARILRRFAPLDDSTNYASPNASTRCALSDASTRFAPLDDSPGFAPPG